MTPIFTDLSQPVLTKLILVNTRIEVILKHDSKIMTDSATRENLEKYRLKLKEYIKYEMSIKETKRSLHKAVWVQCSHMLRTKLRGDNDIINIEKDGDIIELLKRIRFVCR